MDSTICFLYLCSFQIVCGLIFLVFGPLHTLWIASNTPRMTSLKLPGNDLSRLLNYLSVYGIFHIWDV